MPTSIVPRAKSRRTDEERATAMPPRALLIRVVQPASGYTLAARRRMSILTTDADLIAFAKMLTAAASRPAEVPRAQLRLTRRSSAIRSPNTGSSASASGSSRARSPRGRTGTFAGLS